MITYPPKTYLGASLKLMFDHKILQARSVSRITDTSSNHPETSAEVENA
jgi:hypothetical protein